MKILLLNQDPEGKGTFFRCFWLAKHFVKNNNKVTLTCYQQQRTARISVKNIDGVRIILLPRFANNSIGELPAHFLRSIINIFLGFFGGYDVIHAFNVAAPTTGLAVVGLKFLKLLKIKKYQLIVDWDDWWGKGGLTTLNKQGKIVELMATFFEEKIPRLADKVTTVSECLKNRALSVGVSEKKIFKIINGSNIDDIKPLSKFDARKHLGLPQDKHIITFVGQMLINFNLIIESFKMVLLKDSNALLILICPLQDYHIIVIKNAGLSKYVLSIGVLPYSKMLKYIGAADVVLLPRSNNIFDQCEFPARLGDYMASQRPIVANAVGEIKNIIQETQCGLLSEPGNPQEYAEKITLLIKNTELANQLGKNGRKSAEKQYSWEIIAKRMYEQVYKNL